MRHKRRDGEIVSGERSSDRRLNWPMIATILSVVAAVVSPFFAVGEFKGRTSTRLDILETKAVAAEAEVKEHEDKDADKYVEVQKTLSQLTANSNSTLQYLKELSDKMDKNQSNVWQAINRRGNTQ